MKLQLDFSQWPKMELDLKAEDVAAVIRALMHANQDLPTLVTHVPASSSSPSSPLASTPRESEVRQPSPLAEMDPLATHSVVTNKPSPQVDAKTRLDLKPRVPRVGQALKRRDLVRLAFKELAGQGEKEVTLDRLMRYVQQRFPEAELKNLDQVVRDLCNKGKGELVSAGHGRFRLVTREG